MISDASNVLGFYFSPDNRTRVSPPALAVLLAMAYEVEGPVTLSQVSYRKIQHLTGISSRNTISRAMKELKEKGFITTVCPFSGQYRPQVYLLSKKDQDAAMPDPVACEKENSGWDFPDELGEIFNIDT